MSDFISPRYDDSFIVAPKNAEKTNNTLPPKDMYDAKLSIITNCHTGFQKELIEKAYYFAKDKHRFQKRHSGELYISHPLAVARILSDMKADYETICAALLHDVMEDCNVSKDTIADEFGPVIAELVDGVTKVSDIKEDDKEKKNAMTINKLSISFHDDVRVAFIKLADRIHNIRTIDAHASYEKKARIARQTLDIYAPLAALFGLYPWKEELEDICFRVLKDNEYKQIYELRKNFFSSNPNLSHALFSLQYPNPNNQNSFYRLFQQYDEKSNEYIDLIPLQDVKKIEKSVYGIYKKLSQGTYSDISQIKDLVTFNIVIKEENPSLLFVAMYKVNDKYKVIPVDPLIDYVTHPKNDLYRCLINYSSYF